MGDGMDILRITCARPGMWRAGIQHPARAIYPATHFDAWQIAQLRADPAFTVAVVSAEEAEEVEAAPAEASLSAAELPTPRRIVMGVMRLLLPAASEPLQAEMTEAVLGALDDRLSGEAFRPIGDAIFARYAQASDIENTREGRSADKDAAPHEPEPALPTAGAQGEPADASGDMAGAASVAEGSPAAADASAGSTDEAARPAAKTTRKPKSKA